VNRAIEYAAWAAQRKASFSEQVAALSIPRAQRISQRPRDPEHWLLLEAAVRALLHARESNGEWTWVTPRHVVIRAPDEAS
jgi:hypothetical protein